MDTDSQDLLLEAPRRKIAAEAGGRETALKPRVFVPALVSALFLWLCHFPMNWSWLAWLALVPLLCLVRAPARPWRLYTAAWLSGLLFYTSAIYWIYFANKKMILGWPALSLYCSLFIPLAVFLIRRLERARVPLLVAVPVVWTALEHLRGHLLTGFPWYFLGHTQHAFLPLIQIADLTGAYGVTLVVAAANVLVFEILGTCSWFRAFFRLPETPRPALAVHVSAVALLLGATLAYGFQRLGSENFEPGPRVALLQSNLKQEIRETADTEKLQQEILEHLTNLSDRALLEQPDLVVWPETSFPSSWVDFSPGCRLEHCPEQLQKEIGNLMKNKPLGAEDWKSILRFASNYHVLRTFGRQKQSVLLGINIYALQANGQDWLYNSALLIPPPPWPRSFSHYDKIHRVPFGEYLPFREALPFMEVFNPYPRDCSTYPGTSLTRFPLGNFRFGTLICFEDTDPYLPRQYLRGDNGTSFTDFLTRLFAHGIYNDLQGGHEDEPGVDFFINISNDGWFNGLSEHEEHLAICRFRAVECRRSIARAVNMGISAVIDGNGRVAALPGRNWADSKSIDAVLTTNIPIDRRSSVYVRWGDWLPTLCWLVIGAGFLMSFLRPTARA